MDKATKGSPEKQGGKIEPSLFPESVGFREDDPKQGFVYIIMGISGVSVQAKMGKKVKPLNCEVLDEASTFEQKTVCFKVNVSHSDGKVHKYEYKKSLAKPIDPKGSCVKFEKNGQIKLRLKKVDAAISWAPFAQYLTCQDEPAE